MCPLCATTAMVIAGGVASTGGIAAVVFRKFGGRNAAQPPALSQSKEEHHG